ncbi:hypothetical protein D3C71_853730 [compost metagenome]
MSAWLWRLAPYGVAALLALGLWMQRETISAQATTITRYGDRLDEQDATLSAMRDGIKQAAVDQRKLAATQDEFRNALAERQADILNLRRENEEFRLWADADLPDAVARMRERPAITGARGYAEHLRTRQPVRPDGDTADKE